VNRQRLLFLLMMLFSTPMVAAPATRPAAVVAVLGRPELMHEGRILAVAFSGDGRRLVAAGHRVMSLFDASTGRRAAVLDTKGRSITDVCFAPDGRRLAAVGPDGILQLWLEDDAGQWSAGPTYALPESERARMGPLSIRFSPEGKQLVLAGSRRAARVLEVNSLDVVRSIDDPAGQRAALTDSGQLLLACREGRVHVWQTDTGAMKADVPLEVPGLRFEPALGRERGVLLACFAAAPDGRSVLVGTASTLLSVELDHPATLRTIARRRPQPGGQPAILPTFSPDGRRLALVWGCPPAVTLDVRNWPEGQTLRSIALGDRPPAARAFSPEGRWLAAADGHRVRLWEVDTGHERLAPTGHVEPIVEIALSNDARRAATAGADRRVRLWEVARGRCLVEIHTPLSMPSAHSVAFSPEGALLAVDRGDRVELVRAADGSIHSTLESPPAASGPPHARAVAFSSDGRRLLVWSLAAGALEEWDGVDTRRLAVRLLERAKTEPSRPGERELGPAAAWLPTAELVAATGASGRELAVWSAASGRRVFQLQSDTRVTAVAAEAGTPRLAMGRTSGLVQIWDPASGRLLLSIDGPAAPAYPRAFLDAGRLLACAHDDGTTRFWDTATGRQTAQLDGHRFLGFSADARWAASVEPSGVVWIWDVQAWLNLRGRKSEVACSFAPQVAAGMTRWYPR